jgi:hypothetical protein
MTVTIIVRTSHALVQRYREVLRSDYTRETLNETLQLLWEVIGQPPGNGKARWVNALEYNERGKASAEEFHQEVLERIEKFASFIPGGLLPAIPVRSSTHRPSRAGWLAERACAYLTLQSLATLKGEGGFFRDIQSPLFLCSVYHLLPQLSSQSLDKEHAYLLHAMTMHALFVWDDDPSHQAFLRSLILDYLGNTQLRRAFVHQSFVLTPSDDHSYLTKAQEYWCDLVEAGESGRAKRFLLDLYRNAPQEHTSEIAAMIDDLTLYQTKN